MEAKSVALALSIVFSAELTSVELGTYARVRALYQQGTTRFSVNDLSTWDDEIVVRTSLEGLAELGLIEHTGGGWFSLKKVPLLDELHLERKKSMSHRITEAIRRRPTEQREHLRYMLEEYVRTKLQLKPLSSLFTINVKTAGCYRAILSVITQNKSSLEEYLLWVASQPWTWIQERMPNMFLLGSARYLELFEVYLTEKDELRATDDLLDLFDKTFNVVVSREIADRRIALGIKRMVFSLHASIAQFFMFVSTLRVTDNNKTLSFLSSTWLQEQFRTYLTANNAIISIPSSSSYFGRILTRLQNTQINSASQFENLNWDIAEAVFNPISNIPNDTFFQMLANRIRKEKCLERLGFYFITPDKKFTPLAVYWIVFASENVSIPFYSGNGDKNSQWKETLMEYVSDAVDLSFLEGNVI